MELQAQEAEAKSGSYLQDLVDLDYLGPISFSFLPNLFPLDSQSHSWHSAADSSDGNVTVGAAAAVTRMDKRGKVNNQRKEAAGRDGWSRSSAGTIEGK